MTTSWQRREEADMKRVGREGKWRLGKDRGGGNGLITKTWAKYALET